LQKAPNATKLTNFSCNHPKDMLVQSLIGILGMLFKKCFKNLRLIRSFLYPDFQATHLLSHLRLWYPESSSTTHAVDQRFRAFVTNLMILYHHVQAAHMLLILI